MPEIPSADTFVPTVISRQTCKRHSAAPGRPCWTIEQADGTLNSAICNSRAVNAGYNDRIDPKSLVSRRYGHNRK